MSAKLWYQSWEDRTLTVDPGPPTAEVVVPNPKHQLPGQPLTFNRVPQVHEIKLAEGVGGGVIAKAISDAVANVNANLHRPMQIEITIG